MKELAIDLLALIRARLDSMNGQQVVRIASALIAEERIEAAGHVAARSVPTMAPAPAVVSKVRFVNLNSQGEPADELGGWTWDRTTGLVWARGVLGGEHTWADALKACEKVKFMGKACRAPTLAERFSINDYTKHSPALDTAHFAKESGWEWTSTPYASSRSGGAWYVNLGDGYCYWNSQSNRYLVRPVLAGQAFTFDF